MKNKCKMTLNDDCFQQAKSLCEVSQCVAVLHGAISRAAQTPSTPQSVDRAGSAASAGSGRKGTDSGRDDGVDGVDGVGGRGVETDGAEKDGADRGAVVAANAVAREVGPADGQRGQAVSESAGDGTGDGVVAADGSVSSGGGDDGGSRGGSGGGGGGGGGQMAMSADDFLPIFTFVMVHAAPGELLTCAEVSLFLLMCLIVQHAHL